MDWFALYEQMADELEALHGLGNPSFSTSGKDQTALGVMMEHVEAETRTRQHIDQLCTRYAHSDRGNWPLLMGDELYFIAARFSIAVRVAGALATPTDGEPKRHVFPVTPGPNGNEVEWLLVVVWAIFGREWWEKDTALHLLQRAKNESGQ